jgi:magnesium-transporting ATPase (P-type)
VTEPRLNPAHPWHALEATAAIERLGSNATAGLSSQAVAQRIAEYGPNALPEVAKRSALLLLLRQFKSPLIYILLVAATLAAGMGYFGDSAVILGVVLANALIGTYQEGRAERSMAALRRLSSLQLRVLRDGSEQTIAARDLVPGDILVLAAGDAVGADARLIDEAALAAAEAALTGESMPVSKHVPSLPEATGLSDRRNMVFSGTYITAGRARAVVTATGTHTEVGGIARMTEQAEEPKTPLELRISQFGHYLVVAALALFVVVVLLGLMRGIAFADVLMVAISQMVSMVPEGLPVAMTIALAVGMQRMAGRGAIIRRLSAVETLGSTTVICSDKTGTLTRNEMTVSCLWLPDGRELGVTGVGYAPEGTLTDGGVTVPPADPAVAALLQAVVLCNDADLVPPQDGVTQWTVLGDPTEAALLVVAGKAGIEVRALRQRCPREAELPFDSDSRMMATSHGGLNGGRRVFIKGAPEAVLRLCVADGPAALQAARSAAEAMAARALRVLAVAVVAADALSVAGGPDALAGGFDALTGRASLLGLIGQIDPPREEVRVAVAACRAAGIRPIMVTGDHKLTGLAIARELGIAREGDRGVDGAELERMNEAELLEALDRIAVFARVHPAQKLRIVESLQSRGDVVAMTGDGVNDAPALARADVGVAMGITGTEVAKSAAKIVITDDNFATIVGAVEQGRVVYNNLKKVILFLFVTSVDEVLVLLLALVGGLQLPLAAVQILWINIVTESTLTVNLVMDPPDGDEMTRAPVPRNDRLLDAAMLWRIAFLTPMAVAATFGWFVWRQSAGLPHELVRTETFTVLAVCQWFNVLNCQSATRSALQFGIFRNLWLTAGLGLSIALQAAVLYWPPLSGLFHTVPIPFFDLLPIVALASGVLWVEELRKAFARQRRLRST